MQDIKYCQRCGRKISDINTADYFSHIKIKYCTDCKADANREDCRERSKRIRRQVKENNRLARELNNRLLEENRLLKEQLERSREEIERLKRGIE